MSISQSSSELDLDAMVSSSAGSLFLTEGEKTGAVAPVIVGRILRRIRSFRNMRRRCVCGFRAFCGSCAYAIVGVKGNARFFALWKNVLRVTPVPCALKHLSYCSSVFRLS